MEFEAGKLRVQITERAQEGGRVEFGTKRSRKSRLVVGERGS